MDLRDINILLKNFIRKSGVRRKLTIVVSDRNHNVRELLKREMIGEGHRVLIAKNAKELQNLVCQQNTVDILILDPDLAYVNEVNLFEKIIEWKPSILLIIHSFQNDSNWQGFPNNTLYVEKGENSIEQIRSEINKLIEGPFLASNGLH